MNCFVSTFDGKQYELSAPLNWKFSYGLGSPCDAFELSCVWEPGSEKIMSGATRFSASHEGNPVFTGIVDDYTCSYDSNGGQLELSGRGLQGLLLDNESLPVEYQVATAADILRDHVSPYGISLQSPSSLGAVSGFGVSTGQSEWSVIHDFACYYGGIVPRFNPQGQLILSPWDDQDVLSIDDKTVLTRLAYGEKRYGVLSQVAVRDKTRLATETVSDTEFQQRGGLCRRVVTTAGRSTSAAMRYSAQFQLRASRAERVRCELTVPSLFFAFPGQLVWLQRKGFGANGTYRVAEAVTGVNSGGGYTELVLGETDLLI